MRAHRSLAGVNHTERQLFSYSFTLPANSREYLNRLQRRNGTRKTSTSFLTEVHTKRAKAKRQESTRLSEPDKVEIPEQPEAKQTTEARREYDRVRRQTPERKEQVRQANRKSRRIAKETGKCRSCPQPAIPSQTRCETCAEKHRQSNRKNGAARRARKKAARIAPADTTSQHTV